MFHVSGVPPSGPLLLLQVFHKKNPKRGTQYVVFVLKILYGGWW
jgi:hypothetical protein